MDSNSTQLYYLPKPNPRALSFHLYCPVADFISRFPTLLCGYTGFDESGHSTVTDLARLRGLSTSRPSSAAM